jgi:S1-C subfamily serine protease
MTLPETFEKARHSIVALGSRIVPGPQGQTPLFPLIIGTGFVVDARGVVATNKHVAEALQKLPVNSRASTSTAFAMFTTATRLAPDGLLKLGVVFVDVIDYALPGKVEVSAGSYYGAPIPDLAFLHIRACDLSALPLASEPHALQIGMPIATAGFPLGKDPLVAYNKVSQLTPLLRRGIVSSLLPGPCPQPHGFTIDVMIQGGASGSPVFLVESPTVVGMLHASFDHTNISYAVPSAMLAQALEEALGVYKWDFSASPTFKTYLDAGEGQPFEWAVVNRADLQPGRRSKE